MNKILDNLSLCWGSLDGVAFDDFLAAAATAGFNAVTLNNAFYKDAEQNGLSDKEFVQRINDNGLRVTDIDPLFNWLASSAAMPGEDAISVCSQASMQDVFDLANLVGTDLVNAPLGFATPESEQEIIDGFAALCEKAALHSLRVCLEFMPFNQVSDLSTASRIVSKAGQKNGGIMFDCWHHHRGGGMADDILALPGDQLFAVQLDDALPEPMEDILEETLNQRLLPGEGCIDLVRILKNFETIGADPVYDIEVFKDSLRELTPLSRAEAIFEATCGVVEQI